MNHRYVMALAPLAAVTVLASCSLTTDLDSLSANRNRTDASGMVGRRDAHPPVDAPAPADDRAAIHSQDAPPELDAQSDSAGVPLPDGGPPEDAGPPEDRPADTGPPDVAEAADSAPDDNGGYGGATPPRADAGTVDGYAGSDGSPDALMTCPQSPSRYATLYLMNNTATTTNCGYARAGLSGHIAGVDPTSFAGAAACGACVRVETAAAVVVAQVVDQGPKASGDNPSAITVSRAALSLLVPDGSTFVEQGVAWRFVPCPLPAAAGMTFQFQEGSNANYAALLIENHRFRLASVEYWGNGRYRSLTRASYNYWVATNGMGGGPFTLRVTDVHGHSVEQTGVPLRPAVVFRGQAQFPECSKD